MKKIRFVLWNFYLTLPVRQKIKKLAFFERYRRFIKTKQKSLNISDLNDFFFAKIIKKNYLKWARFFEKNKIILK